MAHVSISNLSKVYDEGRKSSFEAVKGIDLEIQDREFMVLVGPSGCGKSTTLRMIAGLESITGGTISIGEQVINDLAPKDRDIAMVFQNYALYPHMSVFNNMAFGLKVMGYSREEIRERVEKAADILGLSDLLNRRPKALSGGQRQRVAVGRAIVRQPKVFLFDEPLSNLDAKMRVQMRTEISKLHSRLDATMIYVTHDQVEAMTMGDRICVMKDGEILQVADPVTLYNEPANMFVAGFIGSPPMNFFKGKIIKKESVLVFEEDHPDGNGFQFRIEDSLQELLRSYVDQSIVVGIRPEDFVFDQYDFITAAIDVIEPMGAESYLYLNTGSHGFVARSASAVPFKVGDNVLLSTKPGKVRYFDPATERTINR